VTDDRVSPTWQLLNMATGGKADAYLTRNRSEGSSLQDIADAMRRDFNIHVSREWVRLRLQREDIA